MSQQHDELDPAYAKWMATLGERPRYFILGDDPARPIPVAVERWGRWFENNQEKKRVARTKFPWGTCVSTVFLGLDHGYDNEADPVLWESMTFPWWGTSGEENDCERYTAYADALAGHKRMVRRALLNDLKQLPKGLWRILSEGTRKQRDAARDLYLKTFLRRSRVDQLKSKSPSSSKTGSTKA